MSFGRERLKKPIGEFLSFAGPSTVPEICRGVGENKTENRVWGAIVEMDVYEHDVVSSREIAVGYNPRGIPFGLPKFELTEQGMEKYKKWYVPSRFNPWVAYA